MAVRALGMGNERGREPQVFTSTCTDAEVLGMRKKKTCQLFLLFHLCAVMLHKNAHSYTLFQTEKCSVSGFSLEHFSILIYHWPDIEMLSLSFLSLLLLLCFMLLHIHSEDKVRAGKEIYSTTQRALSRKRDEIN